MIRLNCFFQANDDEQYETFTTTYQYTPIGHITNPEGHKEALGSGKVTINFTIKK